MTKESRLEMSREWFGAIAREMGGCKVRFDPLTGKPFLVVPVGACLASVAWTKGDAFVLHHPFAAEGPQEGASAELVADAAAAIARLGELRGAIAA